MLGSKKRQYGAETVEFLFTLLLFFTIFFMFVDFSITIFDKGTVINAARVGARQGSLYWVDPAVYDPTQPLANIRMKRSMVETALDYFLNVLIKTESETVDRSRDCRLDDGTICPTPIVVGMGGRRLTVELDYPHYFFGLTGLTGVLGADLQAKTGANAELDP